MNPTRLFVFVGVLALAAPAAADVCSTHQSKFDTVAQLEALAKDPKVKLEFPEYARCMPKLRWGDLSKRAVKACTTILGTAANRACIDLMASHGEHKVGNVDIDDHVLARGVDPWKLYTGHGGPDGELDETYEHFVRLGLKLATTKVMDAWNEGIQRLPKLKKNPNKGQDPVYIWNEWRRVATIVLARLGGVPEKEFLKTQLEAVKKENNAKLVELLGQAVEVLEERFP